MSKVLHRRRITDTPPAGSAPLRWSQIRWSELGRGSLAAPYAVYGTLGVALLTVLSYRGGFSALALGIGLCAWTLIEYVMHRFSFHAQSAFMKALSSDMHMEHHERPQDPTFIVAPVLLTLPIFLSLLCLTALATREAGASLSWGLGVIIGYLIYEFVHYSTHHRPARTAWMRALKKNHMAHHFKDHARDFGVTSPLWDKVFRTRR